MTTILDPTDERVPIRRTLTPRPEAITSTVALRDGQMNDHGFRGTAREPVGGDRGRGLPDSDPRFDTTYEASYPHRECAGGTPDGRGGGDRELSARRAWRKFAWCYPGSADALCTLPRRFRHIQN
jgi:hypothetical protein